VSLDVGDRIKYVVEDINVCRPRSAIVVSPCTWITVTCPECGDFTSSANLARNFASEEMDKLRAFILAAHKKMAHVVLDEGGEG
jgi:hypothetical protein